MTCEIWHRNSLIAACGELGPNVCNKHTALSHVRLCVQWPSSCSSVHASIAACADPPVRHLMHTDLLRHLQAASLCHPRRLACNPCTGQWQERCSCACQQPQCKSRCCRLSNHCKIAELFSLCSSCRAVQLQVLRRSRAPAGTACSWPAHVMHSSCSTGQRAHSGTKGKRV